MDDPEQTYQWLVKEEIPFHFALRVMANQIRSAIGDGSFSADHKLLEDLKSTGDLIANKLERALIRIESARAYFALGHFDQAIRDLRSAISLLDNDVHKSIDHIHYRAVAQWMLGCLLLQNNNRIREAIVSWQNSLDSFRLLIYHGDTLPPDNQWYEDRYQEMCEAMESFLLGRTFPDSTKKHEADQFHEWPYSSIYSNGINLVEVIAEVPAGGFGPVGLDSQVLDAMILDPSMDEFLIEDNLHRFYNLRGSVGLTSLNNSRKYYVLRVAGDSMNKVGIDHGDYVLMLHQNTADNLDIVAAEVLDIDSRATLKRFHRDNQIVRLEPESLNPAHKIFEFNKSDQNFFIRGVVLGVFKPLN